MWRGGKGGGVVGQMEGLKRGVVTSLFISDEMDKTFLTVSPTNCTPGMVMGGAPGRKDDRLAFGGGGEFK